ncbi:hypothetical protein ACVWXO_002117 [Bradyrhizobium sp. LM2.7]
MFRLHFTIDQRDCQHIGQTVIRLLLGSHSSLVAFLATANDAMGYRERLEPDCRDCSYLEARASTNVERRVERGLGVDLGIVPFHDRSAHAFQILSSPVNLEGTGDHLLKSLGALEYRFGSGDSAACEQRGVRRRHRCIWIR